MRREDIDDIGRDLAALSRLAGVPVLWRCAVSGEPWRRIPEERILHLNPCCLAVKADPLRWGRCRVQESTDLERDSLRHRRPWSKRCHAGLLELVVPVLDGDRFLGALIAGPWRDGSGCAYPDAAASHAALPPADERRRADLARCLELLARRIAGLREMPAAPDARVTRALAWIDTHFSGRFSAAAAARAAGISVSRLAHLVREQTGSSLQEHLAVRRVAEARRLLMSSELALSEIAAEAGFADQSHLGLVFRRHTGMTPRRFRAIGGA
jgi:AraC-like DNA-binding protein